MSNPFSTCATCGVEYSHPLPDVCPICDDERQYMPPGDKQIWTTLADLQADRSFTTYEQEPGLHGFNIEPAVGIGHRPLLVQTPEGNLLWDPPGYIDDSAIAQVQTLSGVRWIVASHPHMYGVQLEWSAAFDDAPVYINEQDAEWVGREGNALHKWDGVLELTEGLTVIRVGGHFKGSALVHWIGADGKGVLLSSDTILPVPDRERVTFLRSYPNRFPLSGGTVRRMADQVLELDFDRMYGNFPQPFISANAKEGLRISAQRHIDWVSGKYDHLT